MRNRYPEARKSLARVRGIQTTDLEDTKHNIIEQELEEIRANVEYTAPTAAHSHNRFGATLEGWLTCFRPANKVLYRTLLGQ